MPKAVASRRKQKPMTRAQIEKSVRLYRNVLEDSRTKCSDPYVQELLASQGISLLFEGVVDRVQRMVKSMIVRRASAHPSLFGCDAIQETGCDTFSLDPVITHSMPHGSTRKVEVILFKPRKELYDHGWIIRKKVLEEYKLYGLTPVNPHVLVDVNKNDSMLLRDHPHVTIWKHKTGRWCYMLFELFSQESSVRVDWGRPQWNDTTWFAGVRKG